MRLLAASFGLFAATFVLAYLRPAAQDVEAGTALRMDVPELARRADLIIEARVLSLKAIEAGAGRIETEFLLEVERTLAGDDLPLRAVRLPGGLLPDGRGMLLAGMPGLRVGESALLFLSAPTETGMRMPVGLAQGKLGIVTNAAGEKLVVRDASSLGLVSPGSTAVHDAGGLTLLPYAEVLAEIEAARAGALSGEQR
jgi:hypothetical protein